VCLLALLSRPLVGAVLVPPRPGVPRFLALVGVALRRLLCLLRRLVSLRLRPCLRRVLSVLPPVAPLT
jgi:hypothetical protein